MLQSIQELMTLGVNGVVDDMMTFATTAVAISDQPSNNRRRAGQSRQVYSETSNDVLPMRIYIKAIVRSTAEARPSD